MAFTLSEIVSTGVDFITGDLGPDSSNPESVNAAAAAYGITGHLTTGGIQQFNLPKMKFMFGVQFVLTDAGQEFLSSRYPSYDQTKLSFVVRDTDLPSQSFETYQVNQYNRKRSYAGKVTYEPITMSLFDLQDAAGYELYDAYRAFHYGDFYDKNPANWEFNQILGTSTFENTPEEEAGFLESTFNDLVGSSDSTNKSWGRSIANQGDLSESRFFKRIDILEFDNDYYTAHNIHNPIITSASMDKKSHDSDGDPQIISLTFDYEGTTNVDPLTWVQAIGMPIELIALSLITPSKFGKDGNFMSSLPLEEHGSLLDDAIDALVDVAENAAIGAVTSFINSDLTSNLEAATVEGLANADNFLEETTDKALESIGGLF
ncbi:hypothetical protein NVP2275O_383 [Vibrio phage 2.275.O._10N.286.54.E11]|nr:hypothetical protein NVP2275O_383 [Vibrio phage 2.275.O._10N.286.54.E11]